MQEEPNTLPKGRCCRCQRTQSAPISPKWPCPQAGHNSGKNAVNASQKVSRSQNTKPSHWEKTLVLPFPLQGKPRCYPAMQGHKAAAELSRRLAVILLSPKVNEPGVPGTGTCSGAASPKAPGTSTTTQKPGAGGDAAVLTAAQTVRCATGPQGCHHLPVQHQSEGLLRESQVYRVPESNEPTVLQGRAWKCILQRRAAKGVIASHGEALCTEGSRADTAPKTGFSPPTVCGSSMMCSSQLITLIPTHHAHPNSPRLSQPISGSQAQPGAPQGWEEAMPEGSVCEMRADPPRKETLSHVPGDRSSAAWHCLAGQG